MLRGLYFKHDFNARNDAKLIKIRKELGYEGIGIYWCLVEMMYENQGFLNANEVEDIAWDSRIESEKMNKVLSIAFTLNGGKWSCKSLQNRIKEREEFSIKQKEKAKKRWEKKTAPVPEWYPEYEKNLEKKHKEQEQKPSNVDLTELQEMAKNLFNDKEPEKK